MIFGSKFLARWNTLFQKQIHPSPNGGIVNIYMIMQFRVAFILNLAFIWFWE